MGFGQQVQQVFQQLVNGTGVVVTKYPVNAAGTTLTASGKTTGVYKFAAAGANVKAIVAKNTVGARWKLVGFCLDTFSATGIFVIRLGAGAAAGAAMNKILGEYVVNEITAAGIMPFITVDSAAVAADGANDGVLGDAASSNAGADDTVVVSVAIKTGMGT